MKHYILALMLTVVSIGAAIAANPIREGNMISGHVLVKGSEENIPYATVLIVGSGQGTVSNEEGQFEFKNLPAGKYTLRVSAVGYKTQEKEIEVNKDFTAVVHFQLQEESFMTDEVVVSANRNEVSRKAAPVVVNVMSAKLFEMVNSTDLAKTLNYQSGLRVENNCQNCGFPQVRINGLEGPYSQILINSRPIISALSGVYGLEQIPVNMIERVEVVRGGGSALFGANAVGGTINIITKDPINNSFQVSSMFSNMDGKSWEQYMGGNVSLVAKDNSYGIALYESYRNRNPYDRDGDGFSELGKLNMNTFGFRAYYRPTHFSRINLEYHTTNEFRRGGNKFDLQPHETDITEQTRHIINSGGLSYDLFWREYKHKISLYGSIQHTDRNSYYGAQKDMNAYGKTNDLTWVAGGMYVGNMDNCLFAPATFTGGLEYQNNSMHDVMTGYHRDMRQDVRIASAFVQNEWKMNVLTMLVGARVYGANLDAKIAHGKEAQFQLGFTAQRSRYTREEVWTQVDGEDLTTKRMPRTPDYYGYFTFSSAPVKNFDFSLSGTYTGKMIVPHYAGYIEKDRMENTPHFFDLNLKLNYTFVLHDHIKFQLNTGVQNIFNSFQKDLDKGEFRDAGYFYGPTQPRTFFIGFKIMN